MRVLLSYAPEDRDAAGELAAVLREAHVDVVDPADVEPGANIVERMTAAATDVDLAFVLLSRHYAGNSYAQQELATLKLTEISRDRRFIVPVRLDDSEVPAGVADRDAINAMGDGRRLSFIGVALAFKPPSGRKKKSEGTAAPVVPSPLTIPTSRTVTPIAADVRTLDPLRAAFRSGRLSLVCGAGVSMEAGLPGWDTLLNRLLLKLFEGGESPLTPELADAYQRQFAASPIILARHLRRGLGEGFQRSVRDVLYNAKIRTSNLVAAIVDLCRPQRNGAPLHSIITFNFDDLIEEALKAHRIRFRTIHREGQTPLPTELPIYHVHGFLPRTGEPDPSQDLVFSEDAYHVQFVEPFSWSNLTLLSHLAQNTCLFIGLSMTDPNLRRLLDVSHRKNPTRVGHYVVKRRRAPADVKRQMEAFSGDLAETARKLAAMADEIEAGDAQSLGLNVLWVDDFSELPEILLAIDADGAA
jgi:hypothetical protein